MSTDTVTPGADAPQRPAASPSSRSPRVRPRSGIADAELARAAVVDLPAAHVIHRPHTPTGMVRMLASLRQPLEPDRVILPLALVPVAATPQVARRRRQVSWSPTRG